MEAMDEALLALGYLWWHRLEEPRVPYGLNWEEKETEELLAFVRLAMQEMERRGLSPRPLEQTVRITRGLRVYIGPQELKVRPMAKTVLLLFLRHPEGIPLKDIVDYREELAALYRRVSRCSEPVEIEKRVLRILDLFNNDLNVNIARVNKAVAALVDDANYYLIGGPAGQPKRIPLDRKWVVWE
jgi:hypothetical protein